MALLAARRDSPRYPEGQWRTAITIKRLALCSAKAVKPQRQPPQPPLATSTALSWPRVPSETKQSLASARRRHSLLGAPLSREETLSHFGVKSYLKTPPRAPVAVPPELRTRVPRTFQLCGNCLERRGWGVEETALGARGGGGGGVGTVGERRSARMSAGSRAFHSLHLTWLEGLSWSLTSASGDYPSRFIFLGMEQLLAYTVRPINFHSVTSC